VVERVAPGDHGRLVRKNDSESSLPGVVRLWNRSTEMNPSMVSSVDFRCAAISR
jgi:hypothetical protein